jgi:hypothetical protein
MEGETSSECFFYYTMQSIEKCDCVEGITQAVRDAISSYYTGLNLLLSDGQSMLALRYAKDRKSYYSLYHLKGNPTDHDPLEFKSPETGALLYSKSLRRGSASVNSRNQLAKWLVENVGLSPQLAHRFSQGKSMQEKPDAKKLMITMAGFVRTWH